MIYFYSSFNDCAKNLDPANDWQACMTTVRIMFFSYEYARGLICMRNMMLVVCVQASSVTIPLNATLGPVFAGIASTVASVKSCKSTIYDL